MERRWPKTIDESQRKRAYAPRPGARVYATDQEARLHLRYTRSVAQAKFRGELWMLAFDEWVDAWGESIDQHGTGSYDYCLTRYDTDEPWVKGNIVCMRRHEANAMRAQRRKERV
jgi:hypothetical protein